MALLDPVASPPAGCTAGTSATGEPEISCSGALFNGNIQGYEFGPIGGHGCTGVNVAAPASGVTHLVVDNVDWFNDSGLCISTFGSQKWLRVTTSSYVDVTITSSVFDGNASTWDEPWGPIAAPNCAGIAANGTKCNPINLVDVPVGTALIIKYSVLKNFTGTPINIANNQSFIFEFNWVQTWCVRIPNCHAEWFNGASGQPGMPLSQIDHNLITADGSPTGNASFGPSPVQVANNWPLPVGDWEFNNNVQVNPFTGGYAAVTGTMSGCLGGAPPTGGSSASPTCSVIAGGTLYVTQASSPMTHGLLFQCGISIGTYKQIPGPYAPNSPTVIDEWSIDSPNAGVNTAFSPLFSSTSTCTSVAITPHIAQNAIISGHGPTPYTVSNIKTNYVDVTSSGLATPSVWTYGNVSAEASVPIASGTIASSGTTLTTTGSPALVPLISIQGAGMTTALGNCATTVADCPKVVSGSANTWTLDIPIVSGVSGIAMTGVRTEWCPPGSPTTFSGNVDMTGNMSSGYLNAWSGHGPNASGC